MIKLQQDGFRTCFAAVLLFMQRSAEAPAVSNSLENGKSRVYNKELTKEEIYHVR
ncbi:MAG: hypothetical protein HFG92_04215 [Dorea sp.]|jgi:hypothetical protein|nr:hypothetical protein [Dorea sp.]